jgi:hypothetical protein
MSTDKLLEKNIGDAFTCTGMWWIPRPPCPKNPRKAVYGTLTLSSEGKYQLSTVRELDFGEGQKLINFIAGKLPRFETIWGATTAGEFVTLFDCYNIHRSTYFTYQATTVLVTESKSKQWFDSVDDVAFDKLALRYTHLVVWAGASRISRLRPEDCEGIESRSFLYAVRRPVVLQTVDVGDYIISLWAGGNFHARTNLTSEPSNAPTFTYTNDAHFSIKPKEGNITFDACQDLRRIILNFLSLFMGERTFIESIDGINDLGNRQTMARIRVFPSVHIPRLEAAKQPHMLFPYHEFTGLFNASLRMMFAEEMQPLYDQFFAELLHPPEYVEDEFMAAIRAVEVFHRRVSKEGGNHVAKIDYKRYGSRFKKLAEELTQKLQSDGVEIKDIKGFKTNLSSRLDYGYQYSLKKRLMDILADQAVFLELFVDKDVAKGGESATKILKTYANKIVKTRNYYTHYDDEDKKAAIIDASELKLAAKRLIVLLYMLLLHYVGIPKQAVDIAIRKHSANLYEKFGYLRPEFGYGPK